MPKSFLQNLALEKKYKESKMTITLENVDAETLRVIESLKGLNKDLVITQEGDECPICKAHDYKLKMSDEMKEALKESEEIAKNPQLYPSYTSIEALREALESNE